MMALFIEGTWTRLGRVKGLGDISDATSGVAVQTSAYGLRQ